MIFSIIQGSGSPASKFLFIVAYAIAVFFSLSIHEFAHAFIAYKNGDNTAKLEGRMTINPLRHLDPVGAISFVFFGFGWAKPVPINPYNFRKYKKGMFFVSIAGIVANIILSFVFAGLALLTSRIADMNLFYYFLYCLCYVASVVNLCLATFNLLPIYPLDGFNAIAAGLKYDNKFVQFMQKYGNIILIIFVISGLFSLIYSYAFSYVLSGFTAFWDLIF